MRPAGAAFLATLVSASPAFAHDLAENRYALGLFIDGFGLPLERPELVLAMVAPAILGALWSSDAPARLALPFAIAATIAIPAARLFTFAPSSPLLVAALLTALPVVADRSSRVMATFAAAACGALTGYGAIALLGHDAAAPPPMLALGAACGATFFFAAFAAAATLPGLFLPAAATRIGLCIAASWTGAIALMMLAFNFSR